MNLEQWARVRRKVLVDKQSKRSVMSAVRFFLVSSRFETLSPVRPFGAG